MGNSMFILGLIKPNKINNKKKERRKIK